MKATFERLGVTSMIDYQMTVHPLGGAAMGKVCDTYGRVNGYKGLYVVDSALIPAGTPSDPLLLRRVLAVRRMGQSGAASEAQSLASRFAASRARGDRVHLREEARFALEVRGDAQSSRVLAAENWKIQKEAADARIALEAALASGDATSARDVLAWIAKHGLEGDRITALRVRLAKARST